MPTTTNYGFPTPGLTGTTPDVPRDLQALADAVDAALLAEQNARVTGDSVVMSSRTHAAATSVNSTDWTIIPYDTAEQNGVAWSTSTKKFTIATAGVYQVNAGVLFVNEVTGYRGIRIVVSPSGSSSSNIRAQAIAQPGNTSGGLGANVSRALQLSAGDTLWIECRQSSTGSLAMSPGNSQIFVDLTLLARS